MKSERNSVSCSNACFASSSNSDGFFPNLVSSLASRAASSLMLVERTFISSVAFSTRATERNSSKMTARKRLITKKPPMMTIRR